MGKKSVVREYNMLLNKQQILIDKMSNLGREKDFKVQKIEREYNSKIEEVAREIRILTRYLSTVKGYISDSDAGEDAPVNKTEKKKA